MPKPLIYITRSHAFWFAFFLVSYEFLTYISNDMIMPGMINVIHSFGGTESDITDSLSSYLLGGASLQLILGPLADRYGRRPVMLFGALFFFLCTLGLACTNSMNQFILGRFFQGMGLCFIGVVGYSTLQEIFAEMDAIRLVSVMGSVATVAPLIGPLLGAICIHYFVWRFIFVLISIFALIALWGLWKFMPETVGAPRRDGQIINRMSLKPKVILSNYKILLFNKSFLMGSLAFGLMALPYVIWVAFAPIILIQEAHLSVLTYGLWQVPIFGACIAGNMLLHRMTYRGVVKQLIFSGSYVMCFGLLLMFLLPLIGGKGYIWLMPGTIIYFFGMGFVGSPLYRFVLFSTPLIKGTAAGLLSVLGMCIQALGLNIGDFFYSSHNNLKLAFYCVLIGLLYLACLFGIRKTEGEV